MDQPNNLAPDAPIIHLLSIGSNPLVKDMKLEDLVAHLEKVKALAQSPAALGSILTREAKTTKERLNPVKAKRTALLDTI